MALAGLPLLALLLSPGSTGDGAAATYVVRLRDLATVEVEASLPLVENRVAMDPTQVDHLPDGWGTFVRGLVAGEEGGGERGLAKLGKGAWEIAGPPLARVRLAYAVDLAFARTAWPPGNEQAGFVAGDALYLVTKALFVASDAPGERRVTFDLPEGWTVSVPWAPAPDAPRTFVVPDRESLVGNSLVVGGHREIRLASGPLDVTLVLLAPIDEVAPLVERTLARVLPAYLEIFPRTPPGRYLMTFFRAHAEDGEGFVDSSAFTTSEPVEEEGLIVWGNFLAHELFHYWNGHRLRGAGEYHVWQWFSEGFTEYVSNLALLQTGAIDEALWHKKVERHLGNYLYFKASPVFPRVSLIEAGKQKSSHRFGVYDGGWAVAFALDGLIREGSLEERDLFDFLGALYERHSLAGDPFDWDDFVELASETAETDLADFLGRHVRGTETLPIREALARFGLKGQSKPYGAETFVWVDPEASPEARARRQRLIAGD